MKSKILLIILILAAFLFTSCGDNGKKAVSSNNHQESSIEDAGGYKEDETQTDEPAEAGDMDEPAKPGKIKESDLSEEYRTDLVPIFKGSVIVDAEEDPDHNMYMLLCYSNKQYDAIKAYYKECMSKYETQNELEDDVIYIVEGFIDDTVYMMINVVDLTKDDSPDKPKDARTGFSLIYQHVK